MFTTVKLTTIFGIKYFFLIFPKLEEAEALVALFPYDDFYPRRNHDIYPEIELKKYDGWFIYFFPYLTFDDTG
jgi:hypothetical protein